MNTDLLKLCDRFNSHIKHLARIYVSKKAGTFDAERAARTASRVGIVISEEPCFILEMSGPFFLKYANLITERKWDEFMSMDFNEEKKAYKQTDDGAAKTYEHMENHIAFVKSLYKSATPAEHKLIESIVVDLLGIYCQYALGVKKAERPAEASAANAAKACT